MIMINSRWEQVKNLSDVLRIISENIGDEFAQGVERIHKKSLYELQDKLNDLKLETSDYNDIHDRLDYLNEQLDLLEEYIDENKDRADYIDGIIEAFKMIRR